MPSFTKIEFIKKGRNYDGKEWIFGEKDMGQPYRFGGCDWKGKGFEEDRLTFGTLPETSDTATLRCFTTLCAMMNKQAITQQRIQAKEVSAENEKYAITRTVTNADGAYGYPAMRDLQP